MNRSVYIFSRRGNTYSMILQYIFNRKIEINHTRKRSIYKILVQPIFGQLHTKVNMKIQKIL